MRLHRPGAEVHVPGGGDAAAALARTTHLCIAAHQDDVEIMAFHGVLACLGRSERGFTGATVTDGAGSPRAGRFAAVADAEMPALRRAEQREAARLGGYTAQVFLDHPSAAVKEGDPRVVEDLAALLEATRPELVYTHNLADRHDTHVAVALRTVAALRRLPRAVRPRRVLGCEVWRDLDWLGDAVALDVGGHDDLAAALLEAFASQVAGGKRYDLATLGRRRAQATYRDSQAVDAAEAVTLAMDLTPLVEDDGLDPADLVRGHLARFHAEVEDRIARLRGEAP